MLIFSPLVFTVCVDLPAGQNSSHITKERRQGEEGRRGGGRREEGRREEGRKEEGRREEGGEEWWR